MSHAYSKTYKTSSAVLDFHQYRMKVNRAILDQEVWAISQVDETSGMGFFNNSLIIELGIGSGAISVNRGMKLQKSSLVGVDISRVMLKMCKSNISKSNQIGDANLVMGDVFHLPFRSSTIKSVLTVRLIPNLVENGMALKEIARILEPGGLAIFDIYNKMSYMSLLDSAFHTLFRVRKTIYKHTSCLSQISKTCGMIGLSVKSHAELLLIPEVSFRFVPERLVRITMLVDRIVSKLPPISKITTRLFILASKETDRMNSYS